MSFFRALENIANMAQGMSNSMGNQAYGNQQGYGNPQGYGNQQGYQQPMPDHSCERCNTPMAYQGAHAIRTGGLSKGWGIAADFVLGGHDEEYINTAMERNVILHVFVCQSCGKVEFVNDPRKGF